MADMNDKAMQAVCAAFEDMAMKIGEGHGIPHNDLAACLLQVAYICQLRHFEGDVEAALYELSGEVSDLIRFYVQEERPASSMIFVEEEPSIH